MTPVTPNPPTVDEPIQVPPQTVQPPAAPAKTATSVSVAATPASGSLTTVVTLIVRGLPANATGSVTFEDLGHALGTVAVSGGSAQLRTKDIYGGTQTITARYSGDGSFAGSQATVVVRIKDKTKPSMSAPKPSKAAAVGAITFRAKDSGGVRAVKVRYRMSAPGKSKMGGWINVPDLAGTV